MTDASWLRMIESIRTGGKNAKRSISGRLLQEKRVQIRNYYALSDSDGVLHHKRRMDADSATESTHSLGLDK